jgi:hypothetical protein
MKRCLGEKLCLALLMGFVLVSSQLLVQQAAMGQSGQFFDIVSNERITEPGDYRAITADDGDVFFEVDVATKVHESLIVGGRMLPAHFVRGRIVQGARSSEVIAVTCDFGGGTIAFATSRSTGIGSLIGHLIRLLIPPNTACTTDHSGGNTLWFSKLIELNPESWVDFDGKVFCVRNPPGKPLTLPDPKECPKPDSVDLKYMG